MPRVLKYKTSAPRITQVCREHQKYKSSELAGTKSTIKVCKEYRNNNPFMLQVRKIQPNCASIKIATQACREQQSCENHIVNIRNYRQLLNNRQSAQLPFVITTVIAVFTKNVCVI